VIARLRPLSLRPTSQGSRTILNALAWFGVSGGPVAWAVQYIVGAQLLLARCESPDARFQLPASAWAIGLGALAASVAVLAELAAIAVFRATREEGDGPAQPVSAQRLHFLGAVGITVNPLAFAICAMVAVGVPLLGMCHQS
jgi:hypothetical protein